MILTSASYEDKRQSDKARTIQKGLSKYFITRHHTLSFEVTLPNKRRADLITLSPKGFITLIEIKSSEIDFKTDQKWSEYLDFCDAFAFASHNEIDTNLFPSDHGLYIADKESALQIRPPAKIKLSSARRKTMLILLARHSQNALLKKQAPFLF